MGAEILRVCSFAWAVLVLRRMTRMQSDIELKMWFLLSMSFRFFLGAVVGLINRLFRRTPALEGWPISKEITNAGMRSVSNHLQKLLEWDLKHVRLMRTVFESVGARIDTKMREDGYTTFDYLAGHVSCRAVLPTEIVHTVRGILGLEESKPSPEDRKSIRWVMHFHGGGYVSGTKLASQSVGWHFGRTAQNMESDYHLVTIMVDYALAPEQKFPGAVIDAVAAYHWHISLPGIEARDILLSGESAGGGLAAATIIALRDGLSQHLSHEMLKPFESRIPDEALEPLVHEFPSAVVICSPMVDLRHDAPYCSERACLDVITSTVAYGSARTYLPDPSIASSNALASPVLGELHNLPPIFVSAGEAEIFYPVCKTYADRAASADGSNIVHFESCPGMTHSFQLQWEFGCKQSVNLYKQMLEFFDKHRSSGQK